MVELENEKEVERVVKVPSVKLPGFGSIITIDEQGGEYKEISVVRVQIEGCDLLKIPHILPLLEDGVTYPIHICPEFENLNLNVGEKKGVSYCLQYGRVRTYRSFVEVAKNQMNNEAYLHDATIRIREIVSDGLQTQCEDLFSELAHDSISLVQNYVNSIRAGPHNKGPSLRALVVQIASAREEARTKERGKQIAHPNFDDDHDDWGSLPATNSDMKNSFENDKLVVEDSGSNISDGDDVDLGVEVDNVADFAQGILKACNRQILEETLVYMRAKKKNVFQQLQQGVSRATSVSDVF
ncbi:hypothetical protein FRX31_015998 [Thalictrum thalictroides]|uniref:Uncharacterized protein n=1 Tax=Thalictrum thalictroides TaxID=46969 RepID=A0A7J6WAG6_THATH|nr:hypothetical protein FRX31_015998 [Thalictrum thalictroides]